MLHVNPEDYSNPHPKFVQPKVIGYIGIENLEYVRDTSEKKVNFDLNKNERTKNLDSKIDDDDDDDEEERETPDNPHLDRKLTDLLKFLIEHEARLNLPLQNNLATANFFCYSSLLTNVALTPYQRKDSWNIVAILFKGNIYLCERIEEKRLYTSNREQQYSLWGYKFRQYMLSDKPDSEPNPNRPVDPTKRFSLVLRTYLSRHKIIYAARMDGIRCDQNPVSPLSTTEEKPDSIVQYLSSQKFMELKTFRNTELCPHVDMIFKEYKARKWWCQSYLTGVDTILCGVRDDSGIVHELKLYNVKDLPKMSTTHWKSNVCLNFLDKFLTFVRRSLAKKVKENHGEEALYNLQTVPLTCLQFKWSPYSSVHLSDNYNHEDDPILLDWFKENFGKPHEDVVPEV